MSNTAPVGMAATTRQPLLNPTSWGINPSPAPLPANTTVDLPNFVPMNATRTHEPSSRWEVPIGAVRATPHIGNLDPGWSMVIILAILLTVLSLVAACIFWAAFPAANKPLKPFHTLRRQLGRGRSVNGPAGQHHQQQQMMEQQALTGQPPMGAYGAAQGAGMPPMAQKPMPGMPVHPYNE
ncbi:hypothetical protein CXG81DRAFT_16439 [Caulochytrium protostelioides]|uniref:Uncharacterized protein n=1 Tax=Caulochytrium protostelioides TaxID=1555241 RepID=A0A4P9XF06_9FUNG|nr:hypothetical protein CXG81DRAFT_16439 [Caulochytrium protostelioides]|eukprot:RKP04157.1 hypothetical protein CXG81DRAFT_16439 [Caulochytrium protostelioides]